VAGVDTLRNVRFGDHGTFERAVIDLGFDNTTPADVVPPYSWSETNEIVRVHLPTVNDTSRSDGAGRNNAISRYYVVRAAGATANLYVDFHLTETAQTINVFTLNNPARIVVDITPGGTPLATRPAVGPGTVVIAPLGGSQVGPNLFRVTGYGRPFETYGSWRIRDSNDNVVQQGNYRTTDWTLTWGTFGFAAGYPTTLSGGSGTLQVGEFVGDANFQGATVPLTFR
jgi:hypothetical protein